jgi:type IV pilus assembly protein PilE
MRYDTSSDTPTVVNTLPVLDCASTGQTGNYYGYSFGAPTASAYTISATPNPNGPQAADTQCGALTLNQVGTRAAATGDTACW